MLNLLPPEALENLHREYRLRFVALTLLFFAFSIGIGIIAMLPHVFSLSVNYLLLNQATAKDAPVLTDQDKANLAKLQDFTDTLSALDPNSSKLPRIRLSDMISRIIEQKPAGVSVTNFSLSPGSQTQERLVVSGIAESREKLVAFSQALEASKIFSNVDLPISNLTQKEKIGYSIELTIGK